MKKRIIFLILIALFSASVIMSIMSCAENNSEAKKDASGDEAGTAEININNNTDENAGISTDETSGDIFADDLPDQDFGGAAFRIAAQDAAWLYVLYDSQEETGEVINDAVYRRNRKIEERFNVVITQYLVDVASLPKKNAQAGIDAYELYLPVDRDALNFGSEGFIYKLAEIPNINIDKPYWSQSLNKCLTIAHDLYFAYGSFNLSVYDYTHVLLFGKQMITDLGLENPYELVKNGKWTYDKYDEMAKAAVKDTDGNGIMDENDIFGLVSMDKQVLPCFWIGAGVQSISKSSDDIPQFTLRQDQKFASVIDRIFSMTYDNNSWYPKYTDDTKAEYFMNNHTLFFDCTFKKVGDLRSAESDFGIIPYPKYTLEQEKYYTRVEGGNPGVVLKTSSNLQMIGTILEALNAESAKTVIPAYYDIALKAKYTRDEESSQMLDIIFEGRIYDLGDTYWCNILRDGMFLNMFKKNDRNLASQLEKVEPKINGEIDKVVNAFTSLGQ